MSKERPQPSQDGFHFTEHEKLFDRISHERFKSIIDDESTTVHEVSLSSNDYGEFLFVTTSRPKGNDRSRITFWGAGYHEYRERWITDEWRWYQSYPSQERDSKSLDKTEVEQILQQRMEEISPQAQNSVQSKRGQLFETLADMGDEDGAKGEIEDLGHLLDNLDDFE